MPLLSWLNDEEARAVATKVPYRILEVVPNLTYGDESTNMLIQGDNLDALKALLPYYAGQVKCIYIDPPYNTQNAFEHYDDNLEHSIWLSLIFPRIELLKQLLAEDGFFCCHIDDSEGPYLKILLDELFGRANFQTTLFVQVRYSAKTLKQDMAYHKQIEQVHIYRKSRLGKPVRPKIHVGFDKFKYAVKTNGEPVKIKMGGKDVEIFKQEQYEIIEMPEGRKDGLKEIWASGTILDGNSSGRFFRDYITGRAAKDGLGVLYKVCGIGDDQFDYRYFTGPKRANATKGKYYQGVPMNKLESDAQAEQPIENFYDFADRFGNCRSEGDVDFRSGKKPEAFLKLILERFSTPGDLVLDSFLGSGSLAATAHKMGRKYIGVELGKQAETHCYKRLKNVVDGDKTGISRDVNWSGGGGFGFYRLGEAVFDEAGHINQQIKYAPLAAHVWFLETGGPFKGKAKSPFLGNHNGVAYALLYNGILGDKAVNGGNVLTRQIFRDLVEASKGFKGAWVIYGESSRITPTKLEEQNISFKQTPYDIKAR